jgi:queuosine precursor transporter
MEIIKEMILSQFLIKLGYAFFGVAPIYLSRIMFNNFINAPVKMQHISADYQSA